MKKICFIAVIFGILLITTFAAAEKKNKLIVISDLKPNSIVSKPDITDPAKNHCGGPQQDKPTFDKCLNNMAVAYCFMVGINWEAKAHSRAPIGTDLQYWFVDTVVCKRKQ